MPGTEYQTKSGKDDQNSLSQTSPVMGHTLRKFSVFITSLFIVLAFIAVCLSIFYTTYLKPVDPKSKTTLNIEIPKGSSVDKIADILKKDKMIRSKTAFKVIANLSDQTGKLKAGTYTLSRNMKIDNIVDILASGKANVSVMKITIAEGKTVEQIADYLVKQNVLKSKDKFLSLCKTGSSFSNYDFIRKLSNESKTKRKYVLEGYLFPDTYTIFKGASEEDIIDKMLDRFDEIYKDDYDGQASKVNLGSTDDVIALASIIEKEGKPADFKKISAVFHNRMDKGMVLGSNVTVQYILNTSKLDLNDNDIAVDSPYNTYKYKGLPVGPVSNPGIQAIEAALYPDEDFTKQGYMYFTATDPESGQLKFSKTEGEHTKLVNEYRSKWVEFDKKNNLK